jgi:hypothetical protein
VRRVGPTKKKRRGAAKNNPRSREPGSICALLRSPGMIRLMTNMKGARLHRTLGKKRAT